MFEQGLCAQKPQTRHLIELDPTPLLHCSLIFLIAHTTKKCTCLDWFSGIVCTYHDLCITNIYTQTFCFSVGFPDTKRFQQFTQCLYNDDQVIYIKEFPRTTSSKMTGQCFHDDDKQKWAEDRTLMYSKLDIKPRTILTVDSHTRFCICVHSLYSSNEPFFDATFLHSPPQYISCHTVKSFLQISKSKIKIFMFAQILFMNLSEDCRLHQKGCIRKFSHRHETKLHGININLSSYDSCK